MRVEIRRSGGFAAVPGLERPVTVDTASLPGAEAAGVEEAMRAARAASPPPPSAARDQVTWVITYEEDGRLHVLRVADPPADPRLAALLNLARRAARGGR